MLVDPPPMDYPGSHTDAAGFKAAVEALDHVIFRTDPDGTIRYVNPAFERITGYAAETAIGNTPRLLKSGYHDADFYADLWGTIQAGDTWDGMIVNRTNAGDRYTAHMTIEPVLLDGEIVEFVALHRPYQGDSTTERLEQYELAIESAHDLIAAVDRDYRYLFANDRYREYFGLNDADMGSATIKHTLGPDAFADVEPYLESALSGEMVTAELERTIPDLGSRIFDIRYFPLQADDGPISGIGAAMRDITDRVEHEHALERNRDRLARTEQIAGVGGWDLNVDTGELHWTMGTRALHGVDQSFSPTLETALAFYHGDDRDSVESAIERCQNEGIPYDIEVRLITQQGDRRWVRLTGRRTDRGGHTVLDGAILDITEQKRRAQRLMVLNRVLRHNIRNDLTVIRGHAELLGNELEALAKPADTDAVDPAVLVDSVETMTAQAAQQEADLSALIEMITRLTEFEPAKVSQSTATIRQTADRVIDIAEKAREIDHLEDRTDLISEISVPSLLEDIVQTYQERYPAATFDVDCPACTVFADPTGLQRALEELIENACKHAHTESPTVEITVSDDQQNEVTICIVDNGPGIPDNEQQVLEAEDETPIQHGTGVGLWMVNWLLAHQNGDVTVLDESEDGTAIEVTVPTPDDQWEWESV